jgi:two-component system sensor histidine kinase FlrB
MLPSSHDVPMNADAIGIPMAEQARDLESGSSRNTIVASELGESKCSRDESFVLADAFSDFISSSSRLEISYRELQEEVNGLGAELAIRNAALAMSQAENNRMRVALQQIVNSMPCGVLVVDGDGAISMINPESVRIFGLDDSSSEGQDPITLREIATRSGINIDLLSGNGPESDDPQELCIRRSSEDRWLEIRNRRLYQKPGAAGRPDQTILILRDITARKHAEEEREVGRKAMALAEITTMLAHEIRNPLASLELFAGLIEMDTEHAGEWISNLRAGIRSLSATVNNVLSFHGSGSVSLVPISLAKVVSSAIRFAQPLADQAAISFCWTILCDDFSVMGNESAVQQVILNLLSNALRHTQSNGVVTVTLNEGIQTISEGEPMEPREMAIIQVSDTGCGIRQDQIEQIFTAGFSGSNDHTGLGLAVCAQIMKQHGGCISVSNDFPSGARFTLEFPVFQRSEHD